MLALGEFDAKDLARLSEVKLTTVRTILNREQSRLLEVIGSEKVARRGGRSLRYRIREEMIPVLREEYSDLFKQLSVSEQSGSEHPSERSPVPLAVLAAENSLCVSFVEATDFDEKTHLLKMAEIACFDPDSNAASAGPRVRAHFRALEVLIELSRAELNIGVDLFPIANQSGQLRNRIVNAAQTLAAVGEATTAIDLLCRMIFSPIIAQVEDKPVPEMPQTEKPVTSDPFHRYENVSTGSKSILLEAARIQKLANRLEQTSAAISASADARTQFAQRHSAAVLRQEYEQLLSRIRPRRYYILQDEDIALLATLAAFYGPDVVIFDLESGPGLNVAAFLQQIVEFDPITRSEPAVEPVVHYAQTACVA